jgi:hypothetical protein
MHKLTSASLAPVVGVLGLALGATLLPIPAAAQESDAVLRGRVLMAQEGLADVMVILHRVTMEESGGIDSIRTGSDGDFSFRLPSVPSATGGHEVYFASVSVEDILYFGAPVSDPSALDSTYVVEAFPTRAVEETPPPLPVDDRSFVVEPDGQGGWIVTDIFNVRNDGAETWVSVEGRPVWAYPLPDGAAGIRVGQSDLSPDAVSFEGGRMSVTSPIPPGRRTFTIQYALPDLDLTLRLPGQVDQFSLLVREPGPDLSVDGLAAQPAVELQPGAIFRHYLGMGLFDATVTVVPGGSGGFGGIGVEWLVVLVSFVMGGVAILAYHRGRTRIPAPATGSAPAHGGASGTRGREDILLEIAGLDEAFDRIASPSDEERELYQRRRQALKADLMGETG